MEDCKHEAAVYIKDIFYICVECDYVVGIGEYKKNWWLPNEHS